MEKKNFCRKTETCLKENQDKLQKLAELLLKKETLNYQDVEDLLGKFYVFYTSGNFPHVQFPKRSLP